MTRTLCYFLHPLPPPSILPLHPTPPPTPQSVSRLSCLFPFIPYHRPTPPHPTQPLSPSSIIITDGRDSASFRECHWLSLCWRSSGDEAADIKFVAVKCWPVCSCRISVFAAARGRAACSNNLTLATALNRWAFLSAGQNQLLHDRIVVSLLLLFWCCCCCCF